MRTLLAGPNGVVQPGHEAEVATGYGEELVRAGFAIDCSKAEAAVNQLPVERAVKPDARKRG
jgi:activator of 2-hydroxyglutaryl-CoA dehydratase